MNDNLRNFDKKVNYKKIFFQKYKKGVNQRYFNFNKKLLDKKDMFFLLKNDLDDSIRGINRINNGKRTLKLFFLGILLGGISSLTTLYLLNRDVFYVVLILFLGIFIYCIKIYYKKTLSKQHSYWIFLKAEEDLKKLGVDLRNRL